jgi:hypothetical protein
MRDVPPGGTIDDDFNYMKYILTNYYGYDDTNLFYGLSAPKQSLKDAVTWLQNKSDYGDQVFLFVATHGGEYNTKENGGVLKNGTIDAEGDEGPELYNATSHQWYGVDENLYFQNGNSWYRMMNLQQTSPTLSAER